MLNEDRKETHSASGISSDRWFKWLYGNQADSRQIQTMQFNEKIPKLVAKLILEEIKEEKTINDEDD